MSSFSFQGVQGHVRGVELWEPSGEFRKRRECSGSRSFQMGEGLFAFERLEYHNLSTTVCECVTPTYFR